MFARIFSTQGSAEKPAPSSAGSFLRLAVTTVLWLPGLPAPAAEPFEVLASLRDFDEAYASGLTATGTRLELPSRFNPHKPVCDVQWTLVMAGGQCAVLEEIPSVPEPSAEYVRQPGGTVGQIQGRPGEGEIAGVLTARATYFGPDVVGNISQFTLFDVAGDSGVHRLPELGCVAELYAPDDPALDLTRKSVLWTMGRGYSPYVDQITDVAPGGDGTLRCTAVGTGFGVRPGRWELVIDPAAGYMVRSAVYYREDNSPYVEVTTEGTRWEGALCFPEKAVWSDRLGPAGQKRTIPFGCESVRTQADLSVLDAARQRLYGPYQGPTTVIDNRLSPQGVYDFKAGQTFSSLDRLDFDALDAVKLPSERATDGLHGSEPADNPNPANPAPNDNRPPIARPLLPPATVVPGERPWFLLNRKRAVFLGLVSLVGLAICGACLYGKKHQRVAPRDDPPV